MFGNFELVVLGGGKGSRLKNVLKKKSKILSVVNGKTLLENILKNFALIKKHNLIINQNQKDIINFIKKKNINIKLFREITSLGDAGCLQELRKIKSYKKKNFIIVPGDLYCSINVKKLLKFHLNKNSKLTLVVHPSNHIYDSDAVKISKNSQLLKLYKKPHRDVKIVGNLGLSGIYIVKGENLNLINKKQKLKSNIFIEKINKKINKIYCYNTPDFIKDSGTQGRMKYLKEALRNKKIYNLNYKQKRGCIFFDRDGVINYEYPNEKYHNPLNICNGVFESLSLLNKFNILSIVITNQPAVAKGFLREKKLNTLHDKLLNFFSNNNCYLNDIFYCPHHPDRGFKGEVIKYKIKCNCRKPNTGLIDLAKKKYNIDLSKSCFVGNSKFDFFTAKNANLRYIHIGKKDLSILDKNTKKFNNIYKATKFIVKTLYHLN